MNGVYPNIATSASSVDFVVLKYTAQLNLGTDGSAVLTDIMDDFVDMGSRYLSSDAGGCFDDDSSNTNGTTRRRGQAMISSSIQRKVHYIRLTKLEDKGMYHDVVKYLSFFIFSKQLIHFHRFIIIDVYISV